MRQFTIDEILSVMKRKGFLIFRDGSVNLIGVRNRSTTPNSFDDRLYQIRLIGNGASMKDYQITTDPGLYWLEHPMNVKGTGILKPGQYRGLWKIGLHQGKYEALVQAKPCTLLRDPDKDRELDFKTPIVETGMFGVNCHHAGENSTRVDKWSAACQVFAKLDDFDNFMDDMRRDRDQFGDSFTYTLLEELDFEGVAG